MNYRLVQGVSLPSPCDNRDRLQQTHTALSVGGGGYWRWMDLHVGCKPSSLSESVFSLADAAGPGGIT